MSHKKFNFVGASMVAILALGVGVQSAPIIWQSPIVLAQEEEASTEIPDYKEDFFEAVNKEYLDNMEMAADEVAIGVNDELDEIVDERLKTILGDLKDGKVEPQNEEEQQMMNYYDLAYDFDRREEEGAEPVKPYLEKIESLESAEDLADRLGEWIEEDLPLPFYVYSSPGLEDPKTNELMIASGSLILPDTSYYDEGNEDAPELLKVYRESGEKILVAMGYSEEEAAKHLENTLNFDALMAEYRTPSEERPKYSDNIFSISVEDAQSMTDSFKLLSALENIIGTKVEKINIDDKSFSGGLADMMGEEHFEELKSWMLVKQAIAAAPYLTEELRLLQAEYGMAQRGIEEPTPQDKAAYKEIIYQFYDVIGNAYGKEYFGEEARKEVEDITYDIIDMYKERLNENEWLSPETREKAIEKLDKMDVMVGYGDEYNKNTPDYKVDPEKSFFDGIKGINKVDVVNDLKDYDQPVAENQWGMEPFAVNAYYSSTSNLICLPAGILQAPFYDKDQTDSQNYGGVGNVVGHELTHAFDPSGAEFNADGAFENWWTEEDYAAYEDRTKAMIDQYDGYEIYDGQVDGEQTLAENIADNGGLSVALEGLKRKGDPNYKEFFESYARTWAIKLRPEFGKMRLVTDEHAPAETRTNIPVQNFEEFYETYGVQEGDPMYMAPADRMIFW